MIRNPETLHAQGWNEDEMQGAAAVNSPSRAEASKSPVIDLGFERFTRHFKENVSVGAVVWEELGPGQEHG
jgi:hypothetical protein